MAVNGGGKSPSVNHIFIPQYYFSPRQVLCRYIAINFITVEFVLGILLGKLVRDVGNLFWYIGNKFWNIGNKFWYIWNLFLHNKNLILVYWDTH